MKDIKTIKHDEGAWVIFANQTPGECAKRARQVMRSLMFEIEKIGTCGMGQLPENDLYQDIQRKAYQLEQALDDLDDRYDHYPVIDGIPEPERETA